jgi:cytochrome c-type biogenesis protein CcmE
VRGVNRVGLRRAGFDAPRIRAIVAAFRILFRVRINLTDALARVAAEAPTADVEELLAFIRASRRGVAMGPPRGGASGRPRRSVACRAGFPYGAASRRSDLPMLEKRRFVVGALVIAAAVSYLVWAGIRTTSTYYFEMHEFVPRRAQHDGEDLRVKGWVRAGSMRWDARTSQLAFELSRQDGSDAVPVAYKGILPDMFAEGREVVVEGRYAEGAFTARQIMTSCPSKYEPETGGAPAAGQAAGAPPAGAGA